MSSRLIPTLTLTALLAAPAAGAAADVAPRGDRPHGAEPRAVAASPRLEIFDWLASLWAALDGEDEPSNAAGAPGGGGPPGTGGGDGQGGTDPNGAGGPSPSEPED